MCKENESSEAEKAAFYADADAAWGSDPESSLGYGAVSTEKHPSGFCIATREKGTNDHRYRYHFDCPDSLELFIKRMTEFLDDWKARELEG